MESHGRMILTGENWRTHARTCHIATLSTTNPTLTDLGLCGERPVIAPEPWHSRTQSFLFSVVCLTNRTYAYMHHACKACFLCFSIFDWNMLYRFRKSYGGETELCLNNLCPRPSLFLLPGVHCSDTSYFVFPPLQSWNSFIPTAFASVTCTVQNYVSFNPSHPDFVYDSKMWADHFWGI
jgi:hypothetical protein